MAQLQRRGMASGAEGAAHIDSSMAHPFHILPGSPWPFYACMGAMTALLGMAGWFHQVRGVGGGAGRMWSGGAWCAPATKPHAWATGQGRRVAQGWW